MIKTYLLLLSDRPFAAVTVLVLQISALVRTFVLARKIRGSRRENIAVGNDTAALVMYVILDIALWLPVILLSMYMEGFERFFHILREWCASYPVQGMTVMLLSAVMSYKTTRMRWLVVWVTLCGYMIGETALTYAHPGLFTESVLIAAGGTAFSVCMGFIAGIFASGSGKPVETD